jgi:hypothetical protein
MCLTESDTCPDELDSGRDGHTGPRNRVTTRWCDPRAGPAISTSPHSENIAPGGPQTAVKTVSKLGLGADTCLVSPAAPYLASGTDTHPGTAGAPYLFSPPAPKLVSSAHTQRIGTRYAACRHATQVEYALHST